MKHTSHLMDARNHQIMVLTSMLLYGLVWLKFQLNVLWIVLILVTALLTQIAATKLWKLPRFEWKSAMISGLSLSILMRCPSLPISLCLASAAILSKFIFRWNDKHIFNPTNFALAVGILAGQVTIVPAHWQNGPFLAFFVLVNSLKDKFPILLCSINSPVIEWNVWTGSPEVFSIYFEKLPCFYLKHAQINFYISGLSRFLPASI